MPIYEYECTGCGRHEEVFQKISEKPLAKCSQCSGKLQKLISQSSFHLKGSGWYVTDYANSAKQGVSAEKSETKKKTDKSEAKTDSKPAKSNSDPAA